MVRPVVDRSETDAEVVERLIGGARQRYLAGDIEADEFEAAVDDAVDPATIERNRLDLLNAPRPFRTEALER